VRVRTCCVRLGACLALVFVLVVGAGCSADREAAVSPPKPADAPDSVLAVVWQENAASLAELDPLSLQPAGGRRVRLGSYGAGWSFSPDRSRLVLGGGGAPSLRLVDVTRMRSLATLRLGGRGSAIALSWPRRDRVLAMVEWGASGHAVVVADPLRGHVVARHRLPGTLSAHAPAGDGIVFLLGPASSIGPSRLVAVDGDGELRSAALARVRSGLLPGGETGALVSRYRTPGLAVSPDGERAVVVDPAGLVAEVELDGMAVRYHELGEPISLLGRLRNWLEPPAHAKASDGPARRAAWLDDHLVAVSGMDARTSVGASGTVEERDAPAGLRLIDTRNWTVRTLDPAASGFSVTGELVLAYGALWDGSEQRFTGPGLTAYSRDGSRGFRLFRGEAVSWVQTAGRYAYAVVERGATVSDTHLYVVDLAARRVLRELKAYEDAGVPQILSDSQH
jgi:hypothetical protein